MGQAKRDLIDYLESRAMYDWIEENYGTDVDQDDVVAWSKAVEAYHQYLKRVDDRFAEIQAADDYSYFIHFTLVDADIEFSNEISNLKQFVHDGRAGYPNMFYKMCFAHAVTIFEVYMEGIIKGLLLRSDAFLTNYMRNSNVIATKNISLKDIFIAEDAIKIDLTIEALRKKAIEDLSSVLFHDIDKALNILGWILARDVHVDRKTLKKIMHIRHDIVHRDGVNRNGHKHIIDKEAALAALDVLEKEAKNIRSDIEKV